MEHISRNYKFGVVGIQLWLHKPGVSIAITTFHAFIYNFIIVLSSFICKLLEALVAADFL